MAPTIPIDIVNAILEAAYLNKDHRPNYEFLARCSLMCRAWNMHAQRLYFRWVTVRTPACATSITASMLEAPPENSRMRRARAGSRVLEVSPGVQASFVVDFVQRCAHVYELRVETQLANVPSDILSNLRGVGSSLRNLRLAAPSSVVLVQMLDALPLLTRVDVRLARFDAPALADADGLDESPLEWPVSIINLRELRLAADVVPVDTATRTSYTALFALPERPEALAFWSPDLPAVPVFLPPLEQLAGLRSLALDAWTDGLSSLLLELPMLAELILQRTTSLRTSKFFVDTLPPRLVHLCIPAGATFITERRLAEVSALARLKTTCPLLQVVTLHATTEASFAQWVQTFALYCRATGIEVRRRTTRGMIAEIDLIPVQTIPRVRECTNYSYMAPPALNNTSDPESEPQREPEHQVMPMVTDSDEELAVVHALQSSLGPAEQPFPTPAVTPTYSLDPAAPTLGSSTGAATMASDASSGAHSATGTLRARWRRVMRGLRVIIPRSVRAR
ncbi:hypothetical protein BKA62DRAFT_59762 [Auriculariales sp. MPI-PUGE-AT-0066]|nr:hypothetical protein BKA62DRAFT_59762 [Auriculariales sp. MPI-PUGE-AT-0066]